MAASVVLLAGFFVAQCLSQDFHGGLMTFMPARTDQDGTVLMSFVYKESYGAQCQHQFSWVCDSGDCGQIVFSEVGDADEDTSDLGLWCQSEGYILMNSSSDKPYSLRESGCCWASNVNGASNWTLITYIDGGKRSDTQYMNRPPVITITPTIRIPQNCNSTLQFLTYDPDGDNVACRYPYCESCNQRPDFFLDEQNCDLYINGSSSLGMHVFDMVVEDYPTEIITLSYNDGETSVRNPGSMPLSQLPLQFSIQIDQPLESCIPGDVIPQFLSPTPAKGDVLYTVVGSPIQFTVRAQAASSVIYDFQISGPLNMTKTFHSYSYGIAEMEVNWEAQDPDLHKYVPFCFTAETNISQSEMRCIVVIVIKSTLQKGEAEVSCLQNTISITLKKSAMKDLEITNLRLKDSSCSLTSNESYIMATVSMNSCGTELEDTGDYIVFKNELYSVEDPDAVITRKGFVRIPFSCSYPKVAQVMASFKTYKSDFVFTESAFGSFSYSFDFYTDNTFTTKNATSTYPLEVQLMDMVFLGINAYSDLPRVQLFVESCKATPDDNCDNPLYYDIIKNGCIEDQTVVVYKSNDTQFNFEIEAFKFNGDYNEVYISCFVILCETDSPNSRCSQGCMQKPVLRRRRQASVETERHYISQGPLRFKPASRSSDPSDHGSKSVSITTKYTIGFVGLFLITILVLAVVMVCKAKTRKHKAISQNALLSNTGSEG
ncbi:uncharacterized protein [Paramormyrops kingsleyae]|uniref:Uncharacterized LOC111848061 n=1 Tax=Paramormyrops kingsleyae TaxID=1676925 RepID=A0A3B3QLW6_9TELE|nr:uncharacterized protein LOC111848061 [Paramormyrops kingsleyae]